MLTAQAALLIGLALSVIIAVAMPKRVRAGGFFGGVIATCGVVSLMTGRVTQWWDGGPPVRGPLAVVFSLSLIGIGVYLLLFALLRRRGGVDTNDEDEQV